MVLSAEAVKFYLYSKISGFSYYGLGDVGLILDISRNANIGIIRDHLSGFRMNSQQTSLQLQSAAVKCGHLAWVALALAAYREKIIDRPQTIKSLGIVMQRCNNLYANDPKIKQLLNVIQSNISDIEALDAIFKSLWNDFVKISIN